MATVTFDLPLPYNLRTTFRLSSMGNRDPTMRLSETTAQFCFDTPAGAVSIDAQYEPENESLCVALVGDGSDWLQPHLPDLFGLNDRPQDFQPTGRVARLVSDLAGTRLPKFPVLLPRLIQIVLQQLVSWDDAANAWRNIVRKFGEPALGELDLILPPTSKRLLSIGYYDLVAAGALPKQARLIQTLAKESRRIDKVAARGIEPLCKYLYSIRGIGKWSIEYLRGTALGDADAELTGDYSLPHAVAFFLKGQERSNDEEMLELLEAYRPHRFRFVQLLLQSGVKAPRRGPKMASNRYRFPRR